MQNSERMRQIENNNYPRALTACFDRGQNTVRLKENTETHTDTHMYDMRHDARVLNDNQFGKC